MCTMKGLTVNNVCWCGFLTYLVFSLAPASTAVSFDLTELRNKVAKIKVNPRGNLWATGHFMGKKSVMETPLLSSTEERGVGPSDDTQGRSSLSELFQHFLRVAMQAQVDSQESRLKTLDSEMLNRILEIYTQRK
ncbi:neuromedin Bb isoform X2 [Syngnathus typhle]|uniref:neuromedin Bb isoform X2 n=1 Tax=Syngnathus typhle TaxID=161592 RepID=UPI002A69CCCD|nr:neuromedin Bb isoform X2 [Syngnathus typhle]